MQSAGSAFISKDDLRLGMSIVRRAGSTRGYTMEKNKDRLELLQFDESSLSSRYRLTRVHPYTGRIINSRRWLDHTEPKQIPQKSDSFPLINLGYFQKRCDPDNYQVTLGPWT